jgi:hypothetical protein
MKLSTKVATLSVATGALFITGVALASWTADGSGPGSAQAKAKVALTLTSATTTAQLYPTGKGDIVVTINNSNPYNIAVSSVAAGANGAGGITSTNSGCGGAVDVSGTATNTADLSFRWSGDLSLSNVVVAPNSTYTLTVVNGLAMNNGAVDACSGVTFTVPMTAKAQSTTTVGTAAASGSVTVV